MDTIWTGSPGLWSSLVFSPSLQQLSWSWIPQKYVPARGLLSQTFGSLGRAVEAGGATVTSICTAGALDGQGRVSTGQSRTYPTVTPSPRVRDSTDLYIGAARPASSAISTTGLVIMAEMPPSALHISNLKAKGQGGRSMDGAHILLTGPGLHIAGVSSRAAVPSILTTHGLGTVERYHTAIPRTQLPSPRAVGGNSHGVIGSRPSLPSD